jgi:Domain of unknown function (DUF4331)
MSDHFSGPRALAGPTCDIIDFYAFPSPERPGTLVLVMDIHPNAPPTARFSDAICYRFRLRPVTKAGVGAQTGFALGHKEVVFDCRFDTPRGEGLAAAQSGRLVTPSGETIQFTWDDPRGGTGDGIRVFAGLRADPFFLDGGALRKFMAGRMEFTSPGQLAGPGANCLTIVVEFGCAAFLPGDEGPLFAAVAETLTDGKLAIRLERVGRPEVKNMGLFVKGHDMVNREIELRDLYNLEDPFHVGPDYLSDYRCRLSANLAFYDGLNGKVEWPLTAAGVHPLTELLLADFLVVDVSKPYAEDSFLEIEQAMLAARDHASCGGRSLNDDVMDTLYTLYVNAGKGTRISDGVDQGTQPVLKVFPYLAPAHPHSEVPMAAAAPHAKNTYVVNTEHGHEHRTFGRKS